MTSAANNERPNSPTPEPPAAERAPLIPQTPHRTQTPSDFPVDTSEEMIHVQLLQQANPAPQELIYGQRPCRANAGKLTSTRFHDESFTSLATHDSGPYTKDYQAYNLISITEPATYMEAIQGRSKKEWLKAIKEELTSLHNNNTWTVTGAGYRYVLCFVLSIG